MTDFTWSAWQDGPLIWGGIPSPILEERTGESEFRQYVERLLETIGDRPIILGANGKSFTQLFGGCGEANRQSLGRKGGTPCQKLT